MRTGMSFMVSLFWTLGGLCLEVLGMMASENLPPLGQVFPDNAAMINEKKEMIHSLLCSKYIFVRAILSVIFTENMSQSGVTKEVIGRLGELWGQILGRLWQRLAQWSLISRPRDQDRRIKDSGKKSSFQDHCKIWPQTISLYICLVTVLQLHWVLSTTVVHFDKWYLSLRCS